MEKKFYTPKISEKNPSESQNKILNNSKILHTWKISEKN